MRRASEMPWVSGMVQIGARGVGSAQLEDVQAARGWGAKIITARQVHEEGISVPLEMIPEGVQTFLTLDCDGLDPCVMPAVTAPVPGGLGYWHVVALLEGLAARGRIAGFDLVELTPEKDVNDISALTAARLVTLAIAAIRRSKSATRPS